MASPMVVTAYRCMRCDRMHALKDKLGTIGLRHIAWREKLAPQCYFPAWMRKWGIPESECSR